MSDRNQFLGNYLRNNMPDRERQPFRSNQNESRDRYSQNRNSYQYGQQQSNNRQWQQQQYGNNKGAHPARQQGPYNEQQRSNYSQMNNRDGYYNPREHNQASYPQTNKMLRQDLAFHNNPESITQTLAFENICTKRICCQNRVHSRYDCPNKCQDF